ncbi:MAG TPA: UPF0262 family protein [Candidatus Binatia bacterium]|nr:UPF0262 family protein [Candidatus Binatia bacterium]
MSNERNKLLDVTLDEASLAPASANAEHERRIALFDLKEANSFEVGGEDRGPYLLALSLNEGRLALDVSSEQGERVCLHHVAMSSLRKLIKDYTLICDSYHNAIRTASPSQIEAIDMGRRGLHNEAAEVLSEALGDKIKVDIETARRLFTLVCALHVRG